jgi:hypothetical protein
LKIDTGRKSFRRIFSGGVSCPATGIGSLAAEIRSRRRTRTDDLYTCARQGNAVCLTGSREGARLASVSPFRFRFPLFSRARLAVPAFALEHDLHLIQNRSLTSRSMSRDTSPATAEPFALELLRLFQQGETIADLVEQTGIPEDRLVARLWAACAYVARRTRPPEAMTR